MLVNSYSTRQIANFRWDPSNGVRRNKLPPGFSARGKELLQQAEILLRAVVASIRRESHRVISLTLSVGIASRSTLNGSYPRYEEFLYLNAVIDGPRSLIPFLWQTSKQQLDPLQHQASILQCLQGESDAGENGKDFHSHRILDIILDPWCASLFVHEVLGHTLEADNFLNYTKRRGKDFGDKLSEYPINVIDDPAGSCNRGGYAMDDEGTSARSVLLVAAGVLNDVLSDSVSARKLGRQSNGHGRHTGLERPILPRMGTTVLLGGHDSLDELIAGVEAGVLCIGNWGGGSQGDTFVLRPAYGRLIQQGVITNRYIRRFDLIGDKFETLSRLDGVGRDTTLFTPVFGCNKAGQDDLPVAMGAPHVRLREVGLLPF